MNRKIRPICAVLASGLALSSASVLAQGANGLEEITVVAPQEGPRQVIGRSPVGSKTELISVTRRVNYKDLDLALYADVMTLEKRVDDTAVEACRQLLRSYPFASPDSPECLRRTLSGAKQQVDRAVAAAEHTGTSAVE